MVSRHIQLISEWAAISAKWLVDNWHKMGEWLAERKLETRSDSVKVVTATLAGLTAPLVVFSVIEFGLSSVASMGSSEGLLFGLGPNIHFVYRIYSLYPWLIFSFVVYATGGLLYAVYLLSQLPRQVRRFTFELDPDSLFQDILIVGIAVSLSWIILLSSNGGPIFGTVVSALLQTISLSQKVLSSLALKFGIPSSSVVFSLPFTEAMSLLLAMFVLAKLFQSTIRISNSLRIYGLKKTLGRGSPRQVNWRYHSYLMIDTLQVFGRFLRYNLIVHVAFAVLVGIPAMLHLVGHLFEILF